jgi:16S rRNA (uracil1498-N3)-methyltransferase
VSSPPWFLASPKALTDEEVALDPAESHHAVAVLRAAPGDLINISDGVGTVARCSVSRIDDHQVVARVLDREMTRKPSPEVAVYTGAAKGAKVDGVVERLAELGVATVGVFSSTRSVVSWDDNKRRRLAERWEAIARSAAKQSRSPWLLETRPPLSWPDLSAQVAPEPLVIVLWEEASAPLRTALPDSAERVALVVGPEGGLTPAEVDELAAAGGRPVSLGPRILRTENAPIVAASAVLFQYGLIG